MDNVLRLLTIMQILRDPESGCPWDIQQTFESIAPHTIEEVYEVIEAIDQQDFVQLKEELGDLLLQIVYYAQMANELDLFDFDDVAKVICEKLVRRHPHVFENGEEGTTSNWEQIKEQERVKKYKGTSLLHDVPKALPQLLRAKKIQKRVANVGFDWNTSAEVLEKVEEELTELKQTVHGDETSNTNIEEELGDLLFSLVNLCRHLGINPENALRKCNEKFTKRFQYIESELIKQGKMLQDCTLNELDRYWEKAKQALV